jgi:NADH-quinone oxidoreductase subunit E
MAQQNGDTPYIFSQEELNEIQLHVAKYPDRKSAVMPALWIAQEKFGWLSLDAIQLVSRTLDLPYAHVYGVASFYTMYLKEETPHLVEICTCFTCGECGGKEMMSFLERHLEVDENGYSKDGQFRVRHAECLGACDTAPVAVLNNRRFVHNLNEDKTKEIIGKMRKGEEIPYEPIPLSDQSVIDG